MQIQIVVAVDYFSLPLSYNYDVTVGMELDHMLVKLLNVLLEYMNIL